MSRIGKKPVTLPTGVELTIKGSTITVKGPKGELSRTFHPDVSFALENGVLTVGRKSDAEQHKALHGLSRTLVANMVEGVANGFLKVLEVQGVGYKAEVKGKGVVLSLGFSHQVEYPAPAGIQFTVENNTVLKIAGADKEKVGQVAAEIRSFRPPEPYKGKGVRYQGEAVRRKAGKTGAK
jgi:large subunit ribosomal protein L6